MLKNNYNFGYVKFHSKRGYIQHVCALAFLIKFSAMHTDAVTSKL
mgnify:CR=1 FL=1